MAVMGPSQTQEQINTLFKAFFEELVQTKTIPMVRQAQFVDSTRALIEAHLGDKSSLLLNEIMTINGQAYTPLQLIEQFKLEQIQNKFKEFQQRFHIQYEPIRAGLAQNPQKLSEEGETLKDDKTKVTYTISGKLKGRGQAGLANFYTDGARQFLIKEDDPATCFCEGTAGESVLGANLLPPPLNDAVNYATVGTVKKSNGETIAVSIQDRVMPLTADGSVRPWDEMVYGVKRQPKTLWSYESWYPEHITQSIAGLNPAVKWQLAASLFACAIAGDESLHVGQFMALLDKDGNINGIKRIDLGARERFAVARHATHQHDPFHDSKQYQRSGQWGKDYLSYLMAEPSLKKIYTLLWMSLSYQDQRELSQRVIESTKQAFIQQFENLPIELREKAIEGVLNAINRDAKEEHKIKFPENTEINQKMAILAEKIGNIDADRTQAMIAHAKQMYFFLDKETIGKQPHDFNREDRNNATAALALKEKMLNPKENLADNVKKAKELIAIFSQKTTTLVREGASKPKDQKSLIQIQWFSEISVDLLEAIYFNLLNLSPKVISPETQETLRLLAEQINQFQTLYDVASYSLKTKSKKIEYAFQIMNHAITNKSDLIAYVTNADLIQQMRAHSSNWSYVASKFVTHRSEGDLLLEKLFNRYQINLSLLMITPPARNLLNALKSADFEKAASIVNEINVYNALTPDENGKTALHYLLQAGGGDPHSLNAIVAIFRKSVGLTSLFFDIQDKNLNTPLDILMKNPHCEAIVKAVNEANIRHTTLSISIGTPYFVQDFFDMKKYERELVERLEGISKAQEAAIKPRP